MKNEFLQMDELDNKFIIMARIAVELRKVGLICSSSLFDSFCYICVQFGSGINGVVESLYDYEVTEEELLSWWDAINYENKRKN